MRREERSRSLISKFFRTADALVFSVLLLFLILPFLGIPKHIWVAVPIYILIYLSVLAVDMTVHSKKKRSHDRRAKETQKIEELLLLSDSALSEKYHKKKFILIRKMHPDKFDVFDAIRKKADAIGLFSEEKELTDLILKYSPDTTVYCMQELLYGDMDENVCIDNKKSLFCKMLFLTNSNKYLLLGTLFMAMSFFLRLKIYYRLIFVICMIIAGISGIFDKRKRYKNFLIFLDKIDD